MLKKLLFLLFLSLSCGAVMAQTGKLAGKVIDKTTKETIPFANVVVKLNGSQKGYSTTDINGFYSVSPLTPGAYDVEVIQLGYATRVISGVSVSVDRTTTLNIDLSLSAKELKVVEVTAYKEPIINPDNTTTGGTLSKEQIMKLPTREVGTMAATTAGTFSSDDRGAISIKGARTSGTAYYVNGVKQIGGTPNLPANAISSMTVINGGVPAQYGDAVGGIVNITTSSPTSEFSGGIEAETSTPFDDYNANLIGVNLTGPLLKKDSTRTLLGFFLSGQFNNFDDDAPSALGVYQVKEDILNRLRKEPFYRDANGNLQNATDTLTFHSFDKFKARQNVDGKRFVFNTSVDFQPTDNIMFTVGGSFDRYDRLVYQNGYSLLNPDNNPQQITTNYNTFARFTQNFKDVIGDSSANALKNAYYQIQVDYTKRLELFQNAKFKDDIARYAYVGEFQQEFTPIYQQADTVRANGQTYVTGNGNTVLVDKGDAFSGLTFKPSNDNPSLAAYTNQVLENAELSGKSIVAPFQLVGQRGLLNGYSPNSSYSLFSGVGSPMTTYQEVNNDQVRFSALGSAEVGKHALKLGFEFEQRVETNYVASGSGLWFAARGGINSHISSSMDTTNAQIQVIKDSNGNDSITYVNYGFEADESLETEFSKNLRGILNVPSNEIVNIDAINPDLLSTSLFSANDLLNENVVAYQGYTFDGKRTTKDVAFSDFFSDPLNRPQGAQRPIYAAAFIEDKFALEDLIIRFGVRVDRYDANQKVLKDKYSLVDLLHVKDVNIDEFANRNYSRPSNVGDDWVIYVNKNPENFTGDNASQFEITGYRNGDVFYDVNGNQTDNISTIQAGGNIFPLFNGRAQGAESGQNIEYIKDRKLSLRAFKDFDPQINVSPRLSFSFPISEDALFFAHYDILTQRPERNATLASDYYYLLGSINARNQVNNPDLKPQRKIDYQVGFQQRITQSSGLTIQAFYSEFRDLIQYRRIVGAYPNDYDTYGNIDFSITKGMILEYDLRRSRNVSMGASYQLQFAKGTGSSSTSGFNLVSQGQPNLRTPIPLDFDSRHSFKVNFDFRLLQNEGPALFDQKIFQNTGLNFILLAQSGTPYSGQSNVTNFVTAVGRPVLEGSINGSRLPTNVRASLRIDKDFQISKDPQNPGFVKSLNVYFRVQNLFNTRNVMNVYRYTGSATDDGYLASDDFATSQYFGNQAFIDQYQARLLSPNPQGAGANYSAPRRAYLGLVLTF